jgi:MinD-like ATPase involved in chromosome partitioning or flagellar assembly
MTAPRGRIITVVAAKAGCGKTTFATNLAAALATGGRRACIVDLDLNAGDVSLLLGVRPLRDISDATMLVGRLLNGPVLSMITPVRPHFDAVLSTGKPGRTLTVAATLELFTALVKLYDYIVVDTPARSAPHVLAALDVAHQHVVLTTPERPAVRDLRLMLDTLDLLSCPAGSRSVVLNRADPLTGMAAEDIELSAKCAVTGQIPSTVDIPASVNRGIPLVSAQPAHEYSRAMFRFVQDQVTTVKNTRQV